MAIYSYQASNPLGQKVRGTIASDTPRQARDLLRKRGLDVLKMAAENSSRKRSMRSRVGRSSGPKVTTAIRELATLLAVGIPLTEALGTLCCQHKGKLQLALMMIRDRVEAGATLSTAMSEQSALFDEVAIRMVDVGENSGNLEGVLEQLADFKERSAQLKDQVLTALMYPMIVLAISFTLSLFLMTVVVPMLLENLVEAGRTLPWPTRLLKAMTDLLLSHGLTIGLVAVGVFAAFVTYIRTESGSTLWNRTLLRIPLLGTMIQKQAISRVAFVMATLLRSGVVYLTALDFAAKATKNTLLRKALHDSGQAVSTGTDIGRALEASQVLPPMVVQVFSVGQQSGRLEEMLDRLAVSYDREVNIASTRMASLLEPILIVTLAVFVGFILFATMLPILEAGNVL